MYVCMYVYIYIYIYIYIKYIHTRVYVCLELAPVRPRLAQRGAFQRPPPPEPRRASQSGRLRQDEAGPLESSIWRAAYRHMELNTSSAIVKQQIPPTRVPIREAEAR